MSTGSQPGPPKDNRRLNRAMHMIAVCQTRHPGPGKDYCLRKMDDGETCKEALRALKWQESNEVQRAETALDIQRGFVRGWSWTDVIASQMQVTYFLSLGPMWG